MPFLGLGILSCRSNLSRPRKVCVISGGILFVEREVPRARRSSDTGSSPRVAADPPSCVHTHRTGPGLQAQVPLRSCCGWPHLAVHPGFSMFPHPAPSVRPRSGGVSPLLTVPRTVSTTCSPAGRHTRTFQEPGENGGQEAPRTGGRGSLWRFTDRDPLPPTVTFSLISLWPSGPSCRVPEIWSSVCPDSLIASNALGRSPFTASGSHNPCAILNSLGIGPSV